MAYCPKCGSGVSEEMTFCPQCGVALKVEEALPPVHYRSEKAEKQEKHEKREKEEKGEPEKYEKREFGVLGPLIGGLIMILVGFMSYLVTTGAITFRSVIPYVLVIIGLIVIVGVVAGAVMAKGRHPKT